jgi:hypothetical protein
MAFTGKYFNIRMTSTLADLGKAKVYDAVDCGTPKLHLRSVAGANQACGLVVSSANDPRKLVVIHSETDTLGKVTKTKHYVHMISGGLQYSLCSQIEGDIWKGDNIFNDQVCQDVTDHIASLSETSDYYLTDISRMYNSNLRACSVEAYVYGGNFGYHLWTRIDGVDSTNLLNITGIHSDSVNTYNIIVPDGSHTLGVHIQVTGGWPSRIRATTTLRAIAQIASNAGDPA